MHHSGVKRVFVRGLFVAVALSSLGLVACGSSGSSVNKALKLATDSLYLADATATLPAQYAVDLAVSRTKTLAAATPLKSYIRTMKATAALTRPRARTISSSCAEYTVMAIVGPFNSGVAKEEIPVVNAAAATC